MWKLCMCPSHVLVHRSNSCIGIVPTSTQVQNIILLIRQTRVDENDRGDGWIGMLGSGCIWIFFNRWIPHETLVSTVLCLHSSGDKF